MTLRNPISVFTDILLLLALQIFLMVYFDIRYLFSDTIVTGGDTASWYGVADHMAKVLLPNGRLTGWDLGNFGGYPNFSFYFIPPFLLAVLPSYLFDLPLTITLKLAIMSGIFLLPILTYFGLRAMAYRFPIPVMGASASLLFLFNESYTIFGGNTLSTFAGEFCYMFSFAIFVYFIGSLYKGVKTESSALKNGILLGVIGLSHLFVFIPAVFLLIYWFFEKGNVRYLGKVSLVAFGLMAFWILPLMAYRYPYTTPVYMIWQEFVNWRYVFMGTGIILLFIGPRLAQSAVGQGATRGPLWKRWDVPMLCFSGLGSFTLSYLVGNYLVLGQGLWGTGLNGPGFSGSPIGADMANVIHPLVVPVSIGISITVMGIGLWVRRRRSLFEKFSLTTGTLFFLLGLVLAFMGLYILVCRSIEDVSLRTFFLKGPTFAVVNGIITIVLVWILFFSKRFSALFLTIATETKTDRFRMFLSLAFGCVVGYFSAHFLKVPDIRFLPPLIFVLILIFFAETLGPFFSFSGQKTKIAGAVMILYFCVIVVIFGATKSDVWFRNNNKGYEYQPGYRKFLRVNNYLKTVYESEYRDPLNAPRVGYEKSDMYGPYGGDRVFESLPLFSGRQTMEGIHYASSMSSKFIAFLQTEYSRDIKTPEGYIFSRMNPEDLPVHLDLYNISQLILITDKAKKAISTSPLFEKEAEFGAIVIYRYKGSEGRYVDVPKIRPVLYKGKEWKEDFFKWFKNPDQVDVLLIPESFVKDEADRAVLAHETESVTRLSHFRVNTIDRTGMKIETHLEHLRIRFTTNRVGVPHLIKVSYFPNWKVQGANGIYPVSPHFMLVIPRQREVVLTYGTTFWEKVGMGFTVVTLMSLFFVLFSGFVAGRLRGTHLKKMTACTLRLSSAIEKWIGGPIERVFTFARPYLLVLMMLIAVAVIIGGAVYRNRPVRAFINGYMDYKNGAELLESQRPEKAGGYFERAIRTMEPIISDRRSYDHPDVIHCMLFTAMSYEKLREWDHAEAWYRKILKEYPYSRYVGEANVKIARIRKQGRDRVLEEGLIKLQQGHMASGLSSLKKALDQTHDSLRYFNAAIRLDPYSVWAEYALDDIKKERAFFKKKKNIIYSLSSQEEVRKSFATIVGQES